MKELNYFLILILLLVTKPVRANEYIDENGTKWTFRIISEKANLYKDGNQCCISGSIPKNLVIPSKIGSWEVGVIGNYAFLGLSDIESVSIPPTVETIGISAFEGCSGLKEVKIPASVKTIKLSAFKGCTNLSNVEFSVGLESIGTNAFKGCNLIEEITFPVGVKEIDGFDGCVGLKNISFSTGVEQITGFSGCTGLTQLTLPEGLVKINMFAFRNCTNLISINIPESVVNIGDCAFSGCTNLHSINIPYSISYLATDAFKGCNNLESYFFNCPSVKNWFKGNKKITNITFGDSVHVISSNAFNDCTGLVRVSFSSGISQIESNAFKGCTQLASLLFPKNLTSISDYAFQNCSSVSSVSFSDKVKEIGRDAFAGCTKMSDVSFASLENLCNIDFYNANSNPLSLTKVLNIGGQIISDISIPSGIKSISSYSFFNCKNITTVSLPEGLESIGSEAFSGCTMLSKIHFPRSLEEIGSNAFVNCPLTQITSMICEPHTYYFSNREGELRVPHGTAELYKKRWFFSNIVESELYNVGDYLFASFEAGNQSFSAYLQITNPYPIEAQLGRNYPAAMAGDKIDLVPYYLVGNDTIRITSIGGDVFSGSNLRVISICKDISRIDKSFENCGLIDSIFLYWRNPRNVLIDKNNFNVNYETAQVIIPAGTKSEYANHEFWGKFKNIVEAGPISVGDIVAQNASTANLPINLNTDETILGVQFKLTLPNGVSVEEEEDGLVTMTTDRTQDWTIMGRKDPDAENSYLFVAFSLQGKSLVGNGGTIMNVKLNVGSEVELGNYEMQIDGVCLTTAAFESLFPEGSCSELTITDATLGDVNSDGRIDLTDAIMIVYSSLGLSQVGFVERAADVNGDGRIDLTDAIIVVYKSLGIEMNQAPRQRDVEPE